MIDTIMFDLDGTLLPMDQDIFVKAYMKALAEKFGALGKSPDEVIDGVVKGLSAMIRNDGSASNEKLFWQVFSARSGLSEAECKPYFDDFYSNDFQRISAVCGYSPKVAELISVLKKTGYRLILATNPVFPRIATESRVKWAGVSPEDFDYITTYENSSYCKPNVMYYKEILKKTGALPENCIMAGNDADEDLAAAAVGIKTFLIKDCIINKSGADLSGCPCGDFDDFLKFVDSLGNSNNN